MTTAALAPGAFIQELDLRDGEARQTSWTAEPTPPLPTDTRGPSARLSVELDVDGGFDVARFAGQGSGDLESIDRTLAVLQRVRAALVDAYGPGGAPAGLCFAQGEYGRCTKLSEHDNDHDFPVPTSWRTSRRGPGVTAEQLRTTPWAGSPA